MVSVTRPRILGAIGLALLAVYLWIRAPGAPQRTGGVRSAQGPRASGPAEPIVRIDLSRVGATPPQTRAGKRDLFDFYVPPPPPTPPPTPPPRVAVAPPAAPPIPTPTPAPPFNIRYIASAERTGGAKKAVFLTDKNEVLTGGEGETVANRIKVVRIGLESVDVQDLWSGQPRRIPLKGNQ